MHIVAVRSSVFCIVQLGWHNEGCLWTCKYRSFLAQVEFILLMMPAEALDKHALAL